MASRQIFVNLIVWLAVSISISAQTAEERIRLLEQPIELLKEEIQELKNHLHKGESTTSGGVPPVGSNLPVQAPSRKFHQRPEQTPDPSQFRVYWKDGVRIDSVNGQFKLRIGGRIMNDWAFARGDELLGESLGEPGTFERDGTEFRRARFYFSGVLYDRFEFKAEFDFAAILSPFRDVYMGMRGVPVFGTLRAGHFREPFGLEELTSSNHTTFMERSAGTTFTPARNVGVALHNVVADGRVTYSAGIFRETLDTGESVGSGSPNITARVTSLPVYDNGGRKLLHVGGAYSHQGTPLGGAHFRSRPEAHLLPHFVFTPLLETSSYCLMGLEAAAVAGPFSIQSEYMNSYVNSVSSGDPSFSGFYVLGSFFLTGEHRRYSQSKGAFGRVRPRQSFLDGGGAGAWELAARFSRLDLNSGLVRGGEMNDFTLGLNWYLNPYAKIVWNYVRSDVMDIGKANIVQMRFKIDF